MGGYLPTTHLLTGHLPIGHLPTGHLPTQTFANLDIFQLDICQPEFGNGLNLCFTKKNAKFLGGNEKNPIVLVKSV